MGKRSQAWRNGLQQSNRNEGRREIVLIGSSLHDPGTRGLLPAHPLKRLWIDVPPMSCLFIVNPLSLCESGSGLPLRGRRYARPRGRRDSRSAERSM